MEYAHIPLCNMGSFPLFSFGSQRQPKVDELKKHASKAYKYLMVMDKRGI